MSTFRPSRRSILAMLTALGAASAGGAYLGMIGPDGLISKILSRRLPGVRIDPASIAVLSRDIQADFQTVPRKVALHGTSVAANLVGMDALAKLRPIEFNHLERKVLTFFMLGSNFMDVKDPKSDLVTYYPAPWPCGNRFAQYDV
jgi:hypothetical protein